MILQIQVRTCQIIYKLDLQNCGIRAIILLTLKSDVADSNESHHVLKSRELARDS